MHFAAGEELGPEQISDDGGIVQRPALPAVFLFVKQLVEFEQVIKGLGHRSADAAQLFKAGRRGAGLVGAIERDQRDGRAAFEDAPGGFRIDKHVELRGRGNVSAFGERPAHHHDFLQVRSQPGLFGQRQGNVSQRREAAQGDCAGRALHH